MLVVFFIGTAIETTALDLRLFQRAWCGDDAQDEHEKGRGEQDGLTHWHKEQGVRYL